MPWGTMGVLIRVLERTYHRIWRVWGGGQFKEVERFSRLDAFKKQG